MQDLGISPATIIVAFVLCVLMVFVVRRMLRRGSCDCGGRCAKSSKHSGCSCADCEPAQTMVKDIDKAMKSKKETGMPSHGGHSAK